MNNAVKTHSTPKSVLGVSTILLIVSASFSTAQTAQAQDSNSESSALEEIVVTGSYIRRASQLDSASPIEVLGLEDIDALGAKNVGDIIQTLTINTGSQNNPDAFTQNRTTGTSNFNLRGLGVASTLVLLNGHRQVLTGLTTNDGVSFVDTSSLVPMIAVDSIEILKDGAAALYGTDAVAGVVNFKTRDRFEGVELSLDYQTVEDEGSQSEYTVAGIVGIPGERGHAMLAVSFTDRGPLTTAEKRLSRAVDDSSALGNPGSFIGVPGFPPGFTPIIDPTGCSQFGGIEQIIVDTGPGVPNVGLCRFDFGDFFNLVADETRFTGFAKASYDITDRVTFQGEVGYGRNRVFRDNSPTFPILTFPVVPASNPGNVFGAPVAFFGRAIGNGGTASPNRFSWDTWRVSAGLKGEIADSWYWEFFYTGGLNESKVSTRDTLAQEFQDALNGFGGTACSGPTNPGALPGVGPCSYFNPFATSFTVLPNSQDTLDSFLANQVTDARSELQVLDAVLSGTVAEWQHGPVGVAVGVQLRNEELQQIFDGNSQQDRFAFLVGDSNFADDRDVTALFAELALPITENVEVQLAVRYEDYGGAIGDTTDPKIAFLYSPNDKIRLRGSVSTSFRAPSIFQISGGATSLNQVLDPITGGTFFAAVRSRGNTGLLPEESDTFGFGISLEPLDGLELSLDYWNFEFTDVIITESFQAIINANPQDTTRVVRAGDPLNGPIIQVNTNFVNASSVETDGIDFSARYSFDTDMGLFSPFIEGTQILSYDLVDPFAGSVDGAGRRNFSNFGTSTPETRFNAGVAWSYNSHSVNLFWRYIDSYDDDQNCADNSAATGGTCPAGVGFFDVDSYSTIDLRYSVDLGDVFNTERAPVISIGAINIGGEDPPQIFTNGGFDSKVHDPRGRMLYIKLVQPL